MNTIIESQQVKRVFGAYEIQDEIISREDYRIFYDNEEDARKAFEDFKCELTIESGIVKSVNSMELEVNGEIFVKSISDDELNEIAYYYNIPHQGFIDIDTYEIYDKIDLVLDDEIDKSSLKNASEFKAMIYSKFNGLDNKWK